MSNIKNITDWEIFTPDGWSDFKAIKKIEKKCYISINFTDGTQIKCSENHKIKQKNEEFIYAKHCKKGMEILAINNE